MVKTRKDNVIGYAYEPKRYKGHLLKKYSDGSVGVYKKNRLGKHFAKGGFRRAKNYIDSKK